jgi:ComF family protein
MHASVQPLGSPTSDHRRVIIGAAPGTFGARLGAAWRGAAWLGTASLDALLPPHCLTCEAPVDRQGSLCGGCFRALSFITAPFCDRCGVPFPHAGAAAPGLHGQAGVCSRCALRPPAFAAARAALRYDAAARTLILPFKHADRTEFALLLARHMARAGGGLLAWAELIVPVPLHWRRLLARRYNQSALLAARLARIAARPIAPDLLRRIRSTPALGDRGAVERAAVLEGAFALSRAGRRRVEGRRILLVDDVMTSGATAEACARVLLAGGAAEVAVLAAARVPDPRLEEPSRPAGPLMRL